MDKPSPQENDHDHAREDGDSGKTRRQFKGIRLRKWGSWVSEIRMPRTREKLWLGSYPSAQQAACAYDAAVHCLRGRNAKFNFPNCVPDIPSASSLSRRQIQLAAAKYALDRFPSSPPCLQNVSNEATEEAASPSRSASISETELSSDSLQISEEHDLDLMDCLFEISDGNDGFLGLNLERLPSIEEMDFRECLFELEVSDCNEGCLDLNLNLEVMPAIEELSALEIVGTTWQEVDSREYLFGSDTCVDRNLEIIPSIEETKVSSLELIRNTWQEQQEVDLREYWFDISEGNLNLERMPPSIVELIDSGWQEEEGNMNVLIDPTELWNF